MEQPLAAETQLPPSWAEALVQVQQALQIAEQSAREREKALPALLEPNAATGFASRWQQCLERLKERLGALESCAAKAEQSAEPADAALGAGEDTIREWLTEIETVAGKLADRGTGPVR